MNTFSKNVTRELHWSPKRDVYGLRSVVVFPLRRKNARDLRQPGIEPGSIAWKATMLTFTPLTRCLSNIYINNGNALFYVLYIKKKRKLILYSRLLYYRPCGLMDKASDFESGDCRFESCQGRIVFFLAHFLKTIYSPGLETGDLVHVRCTTLRNLHIMLATETADERSVINRKGL